MAASRADRLKAALRANLKRRKDGKPLTASAGEGAAAEGPADDGREAGLDRPSGSRNGAG